jgi:uncharacterized protein
MARFPQDAEPVRTVQWKWVDEPRVERCTLLRSEGRPSAAWVLDGTVLGTTGGEPFDVRYQVFCNDDWTTVEVAVTALIGTRPREIELVRDGERWLVDSAETPELRGSIDVDLGFTPATNTLPIRRLALNVGESAAIQTAWVRFPELTVEPFPQRYTRLAEQRYLYESLTSDFKAELLVDDHSLVIDYQGVAERLAESSPGAASSQPSS